MALAGRHRWYVAFHSRSDRTPCPASFVSRNCSRCLGLRNEDSKFTRRWSTEKHRSVGDLYIQQNLCPGNLGIQQYQDPRGNVCSAQHSSLRRTGDQSHRQQQPSEAGHWSKCVGSGTEHQQKRMTQIKGQNGKGEEPGSGNQPFSDEGAPRQEHDETAERRRFYQCWTIGSSLRTLRRFQIMAIVVKLVCSEPAKEQRRVLESRVRQKRHAKKPAVEVVGGEPCLPYNCHEENQTDEQAAACAQDSLAITGTKRERERQAPISQQVEMIVGNRPVPDDPSRHKP